MPAKEFPIVSRKDSCRRRRGRDCLLEAIDQTTLEVNAEKGRYSDQAATCSQQFVRLLGTDDVPGEEDDSSRLNASEESAEPGRHLSPVEADNERLSGCSL
jgi:hypothetical protein